jgi:hypothetical protein
MIVRFGAITQYYYFLFLRRNLVQDKSSIDPSELARLVEYVRSQVREAHGPTGLPKHTHQWTHSATAILSKHKLIQAVILCIVMVVISALIKFNIIQCNWSLNVHEYQSHNLL